MDSVKGAGYINMSEAAKNMVAAHEQIHNDISAHGQAQGARLAALREQRDAHNQMTSLTGKVDYT